jgi:hypothetical protein
MGLLVFNSSLNRYGSQRSVYGAEVAGISHYSEGLLHALDIDCRIDRDTILKYPVLCSKRTMPLFLYLKSAT